MRKLTTFLVFCPLLCNLLTASLQAGTAAKVRAIDISGNASISAEKIRQVMVTKEDQFYSSDSLRHDMARILDLYKASGHLLAEAQAADIRYSQDSSTVTVKLQIKEGAALRLGRVDIEGNTRVSSEQIRAPLQMRQGDPFSELALQQDITSLLQLYAEDGCPFSQIRPGHFHLNDYGQIDVLLRIKEGSRVSIKSVRAQGNNQTRDHVIIRETRLRKGEPYRQSKIDAACAYLEQLGIFSEVLEPTIRLVDEDSVEIVFQVKEDKTSSLSGLIGYNPSRQKAGGYLTGRIDISLANLLGTARKLEARWHRYDPYSSSLAFSFEEPWIAGLPVTGGVGIEQIDQDSSYVLTRLAGSLGSRLSSRFSGRLRLGWERVVPDSSGGMSLARSTTYSAALRAAYDTRDHVANPRHGLYYQTEITYGRKRNHPTSFLKPAKTKVRTTTFALDMEHFVPTFSRQAIALAVHGRELQSGERPVPASEHFRLGGATTLRGYRENQFTGTRLAWSNLEYRFLPGPRSRMYLFCDCGTYYHEQLQADGAAIGAIDGFKVGYGFGIRLESKLGLVGVDFGLGQGDTFSQGKIHVRIENQF